jgi:hypothetical protein
MIHMFDIQATIYVLFCFRYQCFPSRLTCVFFFPFHMCRLWLLMRWILFSFGLIYHRVHSTMRYVLLFYSSDVIECKVGCTVLLFCRCNSFVILSHILILCISCHVSIILNIIVSYNTPISTHLEYQIL